MSSGGPDKRTTAYENIFGRPTAKPKGPVAQPPPNAGAGGYPQYPHPQQQQYWQQQQQSQQSQSQAARWNAPGGYGGPVGPGGGMGGYYQPTQSQYGYDHPDRRSSVTPSFASQSSSSSPYPSTPYAGSSIGAESSYGGVKGQTPASAYANFHSGASQYNGGGAGGYAPARASMQTDASSEPRPSISSSTAESIYGRQPPGAGATSSVTSFNNRASSPRVDPPRLPSFELNGGGGSGGQNGVDESNWFKGLSLDGGSSTHSNGSSSNGKVVSPKQKGLGGLPPPAPVEEEDEDFRTPGPTNDGRDPFASGESRQKIMPTHARPTDPLTHRPLRA